MATALRFNRIKDGRPVMNWQAFALWGLWWFLIFGPAMYLLRWMVGRPVTPEVALWCGASMGLIVPICFVLMERRTLGRSARGSGSDKTGTGRESA